MERSSNERYKKDKERYQFSEQQKRYPLDDPLNQGLVFHYDENDRDTIDALEEEESTFMTELMWEMVLY